MTTKAPLWGALMLVAAAAGGCDSDPPQNLAPASSALTADKPKTEAAKKLEVDATTSDASFLMDAAIEKISGEAPKAVTGELFVDPTDVTKTTGLIKVDLFELTVYQQKRESEEGEFGERSKSDKQNQDMRTWFEITDDAPADVREKNRYVEFKIKSVDGASEKNVAGMSGAERKITADLTGELRLHGRTTEKKAKLELTFTYDGDNLKSIAVKTAAPVVVGLLEHDVRPRKGFGVLAEATLDALGQKVAKEAAVSVSFTANAK